MQRTKIGIEPDITQLFHFSILFAEKVSPDDSSAALQADAMMLSLDTNKDGLVRKA